MLLLTKEDIASLRERLVAVSQQSALYFDKANPIRFLTQMYARFWNDLADHASA